MPAAQHFILGAAGHVDHGKTALVTALTGTNTDRLKEELERGISIELGFAEFDLGAGIVLGVVDMPGHERFVKQMVAGAGGVDLALLVIAADEGVMPQTVEHLDILDAVGVSRGVVVMTKIDLVDDDILAVATEEARDLVADTFLADRPIVAVSAHTGEGLDSLQEALLAEAAALPARSHEGPFRVPVDRVFTMPGAGTIVTGTAWSGRVRTGDRLVVEPLGRKVRVREVQVHGRATGEAGSGQRVALALHGIKKEELERGYQVITDAACTVTRRFDLRVDLFAHYTSVLKNRQRLHIHHAGREVLGRIVLLDTEELGGDVGPRSGLCQLYLEAPLVAQRGDRMVLRFYSPLVSIGGGEILDVAPRRHRRFDAEALDDLAVREQGDPEALFKQRLRAVGTAGLPRAEAADWVEHPDTIAVGARLYDRALLETEAAAIGELVAQYAKKFPLRLGIGKEEVRRRRGFTVGAAEWNALCQALAPLGGWVIAGGRIAATPEGPPLPPRLTAEVAARERVLAGHGLQWPGLTVFAEQPADTPAGGAANGSGGGTGSKPEDYLKYLVDRGRAVQIASDYYVHSEHLADLVAKLRTHFAGHPELSFAGFRDLSGLTRKLGIPMLEYLDQTGLTVRTGDVRVAGPRLGAAPTQE